MKGKIIAITMSIFLTLVIFIGYQTGLFVKAEEAFNQGTIKIGEEYITFDIQEWKDLGDGVVLLKTDKGEVFRAHCTNVVMKKAR